MFGDVCNEVSALHVEFKMFLTQCEERSELCQYVAIFQHIVGIIKSMVTADREGNCVLHVAAVEDSMPLFHEILDSYNELSLKEGEWMRWAGTSGALHLAHLHDNDNQTMTMTMTMRNILFDLRYNNYNIYSSFIK